MRLCMSYEHVATPQKVIAYGISRGRAGLDTSSKERPARPRDIPYSLTFEVQEQWLQEQWLVQKRDTCVTLDALVQHVWQLA